jgi:hypothetical protein
VPTRVKKSAAHGSVCFLILAQLEENEFHDMYLGESVRSTLTPADIYADYKDFADTIMRVILSYYMIIAL